jgi:BirA family transcriptional regulator, biotin operon repressor / biotin---[acetyl-CoA-carboxylase] ligase
MSHGPLTVADLLPAALVRLGRAVHLHASIASTNQFLLERAAALPDGAVAWAEHQTAGRGRLGRRWMAPRGSAILLSILLHEPPDSPLLSRAALLAAVAACEAVSATTDCTPGVRWPNDVVIGPRKLGGVLAESCALSGAHGPQRALVIGIGLNCLQQRGHFPEELAGKATSLECESHAPIHRAVIAAALLARLDTWLVALAGGDWAPLRAAWQARCGDVGTRVTLSHDGRTFAGTALAVADDGDLLVQLDEGGRRQFAAATTTRLWPA